MKLTKLTFTKILALGVASLLSISAAHAQYLLELNAGGNSVGEYSLNGTLVNANLIAGLNSAQGIAVSGSDVYVTNDGLDTINEYTLGPSFTTVVSSKLGFITDVGGFQIAVSGSNLFVAGPFDQGGDVTEYTLSGTLEGRLLTNLNTDTGIAVSGSNLFVTSFDNGTIGEYGLGATPGTITSSNPTLITGLSNPFSLTVSGSDLFVAEQGPGSTSTVGEYTTSGGTVNSELLSGLPQYGSGVLVDGSDLYVSSYGGNEIGEYTTSGGTLNANLIMGVGGINAIVLVPEPSTWAMLLGGLGLLAFCVRTRRTLV